MTSILETYYRGITQQLLAEVNSINSIFNHQGIKGEGHEVVLRDLLTKFIPKKYGVGTGIVIDRKGSQSKQIDIVIYDQLLYPSLLSLASVHLFPVDIVYATIEIKTTLTSGKVVEALKNIRSIKELSLIPGNYTVWKPAGEGIGAYSVCPKSPGGFIFAYNSNTKDFDTFMRWFKPSADDIEKYPSMVSCLDQGHVFYEKNLKGTAAIFHIDGKTESCKRNQRTFVYGGVSYPVKRMGSNYYPVDPSRVLLDFVVYLGEYLAHKTINPSIKFSEHYFDNKNRLYLSSEMSYL